MPAGTRVRLGAERREPARRACQLWTGPPVRRAAKRRERSRWAFQFRLGQPDEALHYLERAFARHEDPEIAAHIGEVLWVQGRQDDARQLWLRMQKKHPSNEALGEVLRRFGVSK